MELVGAVPNEKVSRVGVAEASRLKTNKQLAGKARFCKEVAVVAFSDLRKSMACLYQGKWSRFLHWCWERILLHSRPLFDSRVLPASA